MAADNILSGGGCSYLRNFTLVLLVNTRYLFEKCILICKFYPNIANKYYSVEFSDINKRSFTLRKPYIFLVIFSLICFAGCTDTPRDITLSDEYFPLQIGNKWDYESTLGYKHTIEIIDTAGINGLLFFKTERKDDRGRSGSHYARYSNNKIYHKLGDREEIFFMDFIAPPNEPYTAYQGPMQTVVTLLASHETITILGNEFKNVIESYHQLPDGNNYHSYYVRGIGLAALIWDRENQEVKLVRAKINGKTVYRQ
jgi:hypothetical protein